MKKTHIVVLTALFLVTLFIVGSYLVRDQQQESAGARAKQNAAALVRDHSPVLGNPAAPVTIVEFMDPACEACRAFAPLLKKIMEPYAGRIRLVIRYAPLHHGADQACIMLEAARRQGKYWETLQLMFDTQPQWAVHHQVRPELLWQILPQAGLDMARLKKDLADPAISWIVQQDLADARALGVNKTPGFFVNGKPLVTFGYPQLQALVHAEMQASR